MSEKQKKQITIDEDVYNKLKDYCDLNHLTMTAMATKYINSGLMNEMYGDAPFMKMVKSQRPIEPEVVTVIDEHWDELLVDSTKPISAITQNIMVKRDDVIAPIKENTITNEKNEKDEFNNKVVKKRRLN